MLTGKEEAGIKVILNLMKENDVVSLANTLTNRLIKLETLQDAISAICLYATDASDILSRRKVKKEVLFRYLHQRKIATDPHGEKLAVVNAILEQWQSPLCHSLSETKSDSKIEVAHQVEVSHQPAVESSTVGRCIGPMQQMGETFVSWFYRLLDSVHPKFPNPVIGDTFGAHHFWSDCRLRLELQSPQQQIQHSCDSAEEVAASLRNIVLQVGLVFVPNITAEGVQINSDAHGLVKVKALGVVHNEETCVGMFSQLFGLVRDVAKPDNWKIKFTELQAKCSYTSNQPLSISQDGCLPCQSVRLSS